MPKIWDWPSMNMDLHLNTGMQTNRRKSITHNGVSLVKKTDYFNPSEKEFMINYRVQHVEKLVENLKKNGLKVVGK